MKKFSIFFSSCLRYILYFFMGYGHVNLSSCTKKWVLADILWIIFNYGAIKKKKKKKNSFFFYVQMTILLFNQNLIHGTVRAYVRGVDNLNIFPFGYDLKCRSNFVRVQWIFQWIVCILRLGGHFFFFFLSRL